jgi:CO/xanthine dehydrogenase FAD-binding subunit
LAGAIAFYDQDVHGRICNPRVGAFGVADTPIRLPKAEVALDGEMPESRVFEEAARLGTEELKPRSDIHADADYRRALLTTLLTRALHASLQRTKA